MNPATAPRRAALLSVVTILVLAGCTVPTATAPASGQRDAPSGTVTLYSSVTQDTIDAVVAAYGAAYPEVTVEVFRAPTGELDARIASELSGDGIAGDVLWGTDPLSVQAYAADSHFRTWTPDEMAAVPEAYRTDTFWGTRLLNMVIVYRDGLASPPADWDDLTDAALVDRVAIPDPGFAGSAFAALGYFASHDDYGMAYYQALRDNGATQLQAIPEVLTGVAEGQFDAGMTLDKTARDAIADGSPVHIAWPASGAIAIYSPVAVFEATDNPIAAESFANFLLTPAGQAAIAGTGWQPIRDDVPGPPIDGEQVSPDWPAIFEQQDALLQEYRSIFGG